MKYFFISLLVLIGFSSSAQYFNKIDFLGNYLYKNGEWGLSIIEYKKDSLILISDGKTGANLPLVYKSSIKYLVGDSIIGEREISMPDTTISFAKSKILKLNDSVNILTLIVIYSTGISPNDTGYSYCKLFYINNKTLDTIKTVSLFGDNNNHHLWITRAEIIYNNIYLVGSSTPVSLHKTEFILICLSKEGIFQWQKIWSSTNQWNDNYSLAGYHKNCILIAGIKGNQSNIITKTDSLGNIIFEKTMWKNTNSYITNIHNSNDGYFYYGNAQDTMLEADDYPDFNGTIAKIDSVGTIIWQKYFNEIPNTSKNIYNFESLPNSDVIITGSIGFDREGWACLIDKNGVVKWQQSYKSFAGSTFNILACSMQAANGDFVFAGTAIDSATLKQGTWLLRVDSNGCLIPGNCTPLAVVQTELDFAFDINVFPNPATTTININSANSGFINGTILLYDINGKMVFQQAFHHQKTIQINSSNLPKGMYVLRYYDIDRNVWLNKKVIIN